IGKTALHATLKQGHLTASVANAPMYSGTGSGSVTLDADASISARASFTGIQVQPLMEDAMGLGRLSGAGDMDFSVSGRGKSQRDIISSLSGNGKFNLANGQISGVNLLDLLHNIAGAANGGGNTPIQSMNGTFSISQGVVSNHDLIMKMPDTEVSGQGTVSLPAYEINYRLTPQTVRAAGKGNASGAGVAVPVLIQGSLDNPRFAPDVGSMLKNALKNPKEFRQQLKNTQGSIKDQLKGLKELLGK
ncbi:MAG: AsmA-like C-terminal region-containing protein, partial [Pseudomonadota bacterium]|nr:AsmA-like C-terminal region-containing protein [Pseudomonadota bacterium]